MALTPRGISLARRALPALLVIYAGGGALMATTKDVGIVRVGGACAVGASVLLCWFMWAPMSRWLPAEPVEGGLALPSRTASRPVMAVAAILAAVGMVAFGVQALIDGDPLISRRSPAHVFVIAITFGIMGPLMLVGAALGRGRLRLDPFGVTYEKLMGRSKTIAWRDVGKVELDPVWGKSLALEAKLWTNARSMKIPLHFQSWPPEAVADAIKWYAGHAGARQNLTDPEALERWRPRPDVD